MWTVFEIFYFFFFLFVLKQNYQQQYQVGSRNHNVYNLLKNKLGSGNLSWQACTKFPVFVHNLCTNCTQTPETLCKACQEGMALKSMKGCPSWTYVWVVNCSPQLNDNCIRAISAYILWLVQCSHSSKPESLQNIITHYW